MALINPIDYIAIRNTIAEYCIALDEKDWPLLDTVFTDDVDAYYPFAEMKGVKKVAEAIENRYTTHVFRILSETGKAKDSEVATHYIPARSHNPDYRD